MIGFIQTKNAYCHYRASEPLLDQKFQIFLNQTKSVEKSIVNRAQQKTMNGYFSADNGLPPALAELRRFQHTSHAEQIGLNYIWTCNEFGKRINISIYIIL